MESANVELSALYVEMGLGVAFATLAQGLLPTRRPPPGLSAPAPITSSPDHLAVVLRRDQVLGLLQEGLYKSPLWGYNSAGVNPRSALPAIARSYLSLALAASWGSVAR